MFEQETSDSDVDEEMQKHRNGVFTAASTSVNTDRHHLATSVQVCAVLCYSSNHMQCVVFQIGNAAYNTCLSSG